MIQTQESFEWAETKQPDHVFGYRRSYKNIYRQREFKVYKAMLNVWERTEFFVDLLRLYFDLKRATTMCVLIGVHVFIPQYYNDTIMYQRVFMD